MSLGPWMRQKHLVAPAVALTAVLMVLTVGWALADGFVAPTSIPLHVSPGARVEPGTVVTFSGTLRSPRAFCRRNSVVTLRVYGETFGEPAPGGRVESMETRPDGSFRFRVPITEQARYRVWFRGKVGGVHPNINTCQKSRSRTITIHAK